MRRPDPELEMVHIRECIDLGDPLTNAQALVLLSKLEQARGELVIIKVQLGAAIEEAKRRG